MLQIRDAELNDLQTIHDLAHEIWPSAYLEILGQAQLNYMLEKIYSMPALQYQFSVLQHRFIIVSDEYNEPAGFASFAAHEDERVYHLHKLYVLPGQQGKQVGKQLLHHVIHQIRKTGATSLQLNVNRHNKALLFYQKLGFTIIRQEDIDIGSGYFMNDYVMELRL